MSGFLSHFVLPALLVTSASADLVLGTFDTPAADSLAVKKAYGASSFSNEASPRALSVVNGALTLTTTLANQPGGEYSANGGILMPLNSLWAPTDIRIATAISFRIKGSGAYNVNVALGSDAYKFGADGVVQVAPVKVTSAWTTVSIALTPTPAFAWLSWMENEERYPGGTAASIITDPTAAGYADEAVNVALTVKQVQFNIDPTWSGPTKWTAPAAGVTTLSVDDIVLVGYDRPIVNGVGCQAKLPSTVFSDLKSPSNAAGGYWFAYTDTGATGPAKGTSSVVLPAGRKAWAVDTALGAATLVANLERPATSVYGGFAGIGSGAPEGDLLNLTGLAAIGFPLAIPAGAGIDVDKVQGIEFKVAKASVADSATHSVFIPAYQFAAGPTDICVDVGMLKMPAWMIGKTGFQEFSPEDVTRLSWEIKIADQTGVVTSVPAQGFMVGAVTFHGLSKLPVGVGPRLQRTAPNFSARYTEGLLSLRGLDGYATLEIVSLSGARVASLPVASTVRLHLDRGAYLLVARGEGRPALSRSLAVAR